MKRKKAVKRKAKALTASELKKISAGVFAAQRAGDYLYREGYETGGRVPTRLYRER